jgi:uncharacterized protein (DUF1501 family)
MRRRDFLKTSAVASAAFSSNLVGYHTSTAQARTMAPDKNPVLVVIYLRGGQDQLNTIIPYNDSRYYEIRPTVGIPQERVIPLDDQWAFHPAMAPLKPFYDDGSFAAVINSGSPHPTRSHFDAQDFMEYAAPGDRTIRDGWLNRYLTATAPDERMMDYMQPELRACAMQELLPRSMRGSYPIVAVPNNLDQLQSVLDLFEGFYGSGSEEDAASALRRATNIRKGVEADPVMASGRETINGLRRLHELLYGEGQENEVAELGAFQEYPGGYFADRLSKIAKLIRAGVGMELAATDINGWDHHIGMGSVDGALHRMLAFLSEGLAAFMKDLGPDLQRTCIVVCTEFGRVAKENGNDGSDHGHGGPMWVMGGGVRGGKIYGKWTGLQESVLYQKRDQPVTTDFRQIFNEVLVKHMKFEPKPDFFPNYQMPAGELGLFA